MASKHVSGDQLETLMAITDPKRFAGENGNIDEAKLTEHLTRLFGAGDTQQQGTATNWGQHSGAVPRASSSAMTAAPRYENGTASAVTQINQQQATTSRGARTHAQRSNADTESNDEQPNRMNPDTRNARHGPHRNEQALPPGAPN